jgi:hypothetical protein
VAWIDHVDSKNLKTAPQESADKTQTWEAAEKEISQDAREDIEITGDIWLPPRDSNPDMLIQSQLSCR